MAEDLEEVRKCVHCIILPSGTDGLDIGGVARDYASLIGEEIPWKKYANTLYEFLRAIPIIYEQRGRWFIRPTEDTKHISDQVAKQKTKKKKAKRGGSFGGGRGRYPIPSYRPTYQPTSSYSSRGGSGYQPSSSYSSRGGGVHSSSWRGSHNGSAPREPLRAAPQPAATRPPPQTQPVPPSKRVSLLSGTGYGVAGSTTGSTPQALNPPNSAGPKSQTSTRWSSTAPPSTHTSNGWPSTAPPSDAVSAVCSSSVNMPQAPVIQSRTIVLEAAIRVFEDFMASSQLDASLTLRIGNNSYVKTLQTDTSSELTSLFKQVDGDKQSIMAKATQRFSFSEMPALTFPHGNTCDVIIIDVHNSNHITARLQSTDNELDKQQQELAIYYTPLADIRNASEAFRRDPTSVSFKLNDMCAVYNSTWWRVRLLSCTNDRWNIVYVDYGSEQRNVDCKTLFPLSPAFIALPAQKFLLSLAGFRIFSTCEAITTFLRDKIENSYVTIEGTYKTGQDANSWIVEQIYMLDESTNSYCSFIDTFKTFVVDRVSPAINKVGDVTVQVGGAGTDDSSGLLYCNVLKHIDEFTNYMDQVNKLLLTLRKDREPVEMRDVNVEDDFMYMAFYKQNDGIDVGSYYRCKVEDIDVKYTVNFIDFGNTEEVTELFYIGDIPEVCILPEQAVGICIANLPPEHHSWSSIGTQRLRELTYDTLKGTVVVPKDDPSSEDYCQVSLVLEATGENIMERLHCKAENFYRTGLPELEVTVGNEYSVSCLMINQTAAEIELTMGVYGAMPAEDLTEMICDKYSANDPPSLLRVPVVGEIILHKLVRKTKTPTDKPEVQYYRCNVLMVPKLPDGVAPTEQKIRVHYLDYGNQKTVTIDTCFLLDSKFAFLPAQCLMVSLDGVPVPEDGVYPAELLAHLRRLLMLELKVKLLALRSPNLYRAAMTTAEGHDVNGYLQQFL